MKSTPKRQTKKPRVLNNIVAFPGADPILMATRRTLTDECRFDDIDGGWAIRDADDIVIGYLLKADQSLRRSA